VSSSLKCRNWSAQLWQITRCYSVYIPVDSDTQTEFCPITDVQPVKDVALHVCETLSNFRVLVMSREVALITSCTFSVVSHDRQLHALMTLPLLIHQVMCVRLFCSWPLEVVFYLLPGEAWSKGITARPQQKTYYSKQDWKSDSTRDLINQKCETRSKRDKPLREKLT